jgi:hypothetical protein
MLLSIRILIEEMQKKFFLERLEVFSIIKIMSELSLFYRQL